MQSEVENKRKTRGIHKILLWSFKPLCSLNISHDCISNPIFLCSSHSCFFLFNALASWRLGTIKRRKNPLQWWSNFVCWSRKRCHHAGKWIFFIERVACLYYFITNASWQRAVTNFPSPRPSRSHLNKIWIIIIVNSLSNAPYQLTDLMKNYF